MRRIEARAGANVLSWDRYSANGIHSCAGPLGKVCLQLSVLLYLSSLCPGRNNGLFRGLLLKSKSLCPGLLEYRVRRRHSGVWCDLGNLQPDAGALRRGGETGKISAPRSHRRRRDRSDSAELAQFQLGLPIRSDGTPRPQLARDSSDFFGPDPGPAALLWDSSGPEFEGHDRRLLPVHRRPDLRPRVSNFSAAGISACAVCIHGGSWRVVRISLVLPPQSA